MGNRGDVNRLEGNVRVCISPIPSGTQIIGEDPNRTIPGSFGSALVAAEILLHDSVSKSHGLPKRNTKVEKLLKQPQNHWFHGAWDSIRLHVWKLSGEPSDARNFHKRLFRELPHLEGNPPLGSMIFNDANRRVLYQPRHLFADFLLHLFYGEQFETDVYQGL